MLSLASNTAAIVCCRDAVDRQINLESWRLSSNKSQFHAHCSRRSTICQKNIRDHIGRK